MTDKMFSDKQSPGIKKLCSFIPYFENIDPDKVCQWKGGYKDKDGAMHLLYPVYDDEFKKFIDAFEESGMAVDNYKDELDRRIPARQTDIRKVVETADFELLKVILTNCIRAEQSCDGAWEEAIKNGLFLEVLRRLKALK